MRRRALQVSIAFVLLAVAMQALTLARRPRVERVLVTQTVAPTPPWVQTPSKRSRPPNDSAAIRQLLGTALSHIDTESLRDVVIQGDTAWVTGTTRSRSSTETYQVIRTSGEWRVLKVTRACSVGPANCAGAARGAGIKG